MKRILHTADTHIGYSAYRRIDEATGLNQREVDTYEAFKQFVDYALKERPDVIVHAGDLFDSVHPTNRAISFVLGQLIRLSEEGIPFVAISGNHETPRLKETGSVFSLFEHILHVHAVYGNHYELVDVDDLKVHALRTREMVDLEPVVCGSLDEHGIKRAIKHRIQESNPRDKVVRLKVLDIPLHVYHSLDFDELKRLTRSAVHFEIKYEFRRDNELFSAEHLTFHSLHTEFEHFIGRYLIGAHVNKARLKELGLRYMQEGEEENEE